MSNFAFLAAEFPAVHEAARLMPLMSEVARAQLVMPGLDPGIHVFLEVAKREFRMREVSAGLVCETAEP